jgi:hypothetical protein
MTEEQAIAQATQEVEAEKPLTKNINGVVSDFTEEDYQDRIQSRATYILDQYNNGYIIARQSAYLPIAEQLDMMYWDNVNGTTTWKDHIAQVKSDNPKPA